MTQRHPRSREHGFLLIEALVAILIFSLGILGMIAMGTTAISAQSDAHFRTDAAKLTEDLVSTIALNVARPGGIVDTTQLNQFNHFPTTTPDTPCVFSGGASTQAIVTNWVADVETVGPGLPGLPADPTENGHREHISVSTAAGGYNQVEVTVCWRAPGTPSTTPMRHHTLVTYIN